MKLNNTHQLLVCADDVNTFGGSVHTLKKNKEILEVAGKEIALEVNVDKTKYEVMSRDQNAGQSPRYLGTTLTNQNSIQEEIKSSLKSGNACYLSFCTFCVFCLPN